MDRLKVSPIAISAVVISALATVAPPISPAVSSLQALPFLLLGPGLAWLGGVRSIGILQLVALAVGLSLAAETLVGALLFTFGRWSPQIGHGVLILYALLGVLITWRTRGDASRDRADTWP
jgi:hypothetical protein